MLKQTASSKETNQQHMHDTHEVKTLLEWVAPGRPFKKRTRVYYATTLVIMFFVLVLLFLFSMYLEMVVVVSLVFLAFAFASVPPHNFQYRISSEGIFIEDHFTLWQELYDFYIAKQNDQKIIVIRTRMFYPGEIYLTPSEDTQLEKIKAAILPHLPFREYIKPTIVERSSNWMEKNFPLEPISSSKPTRKVAS